MMPARVVVFCLLILIISNHGCTSSKNISVPEVIAEKKMTNVISGKEALEVINKLHNLEIAPEQNIIAEYGDDPKDLLYISRYSTEEKAKETLQLMIKKMVEAEDGPFTHIRTLPDYEDDVYISIGMGAIHYIYQSDGYVLWLQTFQEIGRELPNTLLRLYPVK